MLNKILLFFVFLIVVAGIGFFVVSDKLKPLSNNEAKQDFLIVKGWGAGRVASELESQGLIKDKYVFRALLILTGNTKTIQAGEYSLSPSMNPLKIINEFEKGPVQLWLTIPEGLRREEVASRVTATLEKDKEFEEEFLRLTQGKEGYLFPETYLFAKDVTAAKVVNKLLSTFDEKVALLTKTSSLSEHDLVTLASLIERETKNTNEREIVAGILMNRLENDWPLQVDATVQYITGKPGNWWGGITRADIELNSPYNTYKVRGLPPTPIASPGFTALEAAYNPKANDYWYYIHDNEGVIHYAKTLDEHNKNVRVYLGK